MDYRALPDDSRVWIYQSSRNFQEKEVEEIKTYGKKFIDNWATHGTELTAAFEVFYDRFIVLFADESQIKASGCSIDASVKFIKDIQHAYQVDLFDRLSIAFRTNREIDTLRMHDFQTALDQGKLKGSTIVFNNLVESKRDFMEAWEVKLEESWHVRMLSA